MVVTLNTELEDEVASVPRRSRSLYFKVLADIRRD